MSWLRNRFRQLRRDRRGVAAIEFGIAGPVFILLVMGLIELGHNFYVKSIMIGEMERAARLTSLESAGSAQTAIDTRLRTQLQRVIAGANVTFSRKAYRNYSNIKTKAEPYTENNGDKTCNKGEVFEDLNGNGTWDKDSGKANSLGGANEIVFYTVTVTYPHIVPYMAALTGTANMKMTQTTVMRNQPYAPTAAVVTKTCP
jgi:Flp pilus assembly protein TadG